MRILIVSDIHSNFVALETVLSVAGSFDDIWNLGDTIGYGPRPNECVEATKHASVKIAGNHDLASLGRVDIKDFNPAARDANIWNGKQLTPENREFLESLPPSYEIDEQFMVAHASPSQPVWEYLLTLEQARNNFKHFVSQVCFIGHSHVPLYFVHHADGRCEGPKLPDAGEVLKLEDDKRYIINPGSVGQPRNQDPRAAFAVLDRETNSVEFHRTKYNIALTQQQMHEANLPLALIRRLEYGM
jgi:diadenosine tetraphosphatase ApaH/serine/threonine PP2A family protein phosphatase